MSDKARLRFEREVLGGMARTYGVSSVSSKKFSIDPTHAQALSNKIVEQSTFLAKVNHIPVDELEGENILGYANSPVTSRTDTSGAGERSPKQVLGLSSYKYKLAKTDSDTALRYATIDMWGKFPDLADRYSAYVQERISADLELMGWYGTSVAVDTDLAANPLLQDVNKGWLQYMRENLPANILTGSIKIGKGGDLSCLDAAIHDMVQGIPYFMRKDLVALIGEDLISTEKAILFDAVQGVPTEKVAMDGFSQRYGGLPWETPSFFPARGIVITSYSNLSLYHQDNSWRRKITDNPKKDQYEDYLSRNMGFVVENPEAFVALELDTVQIPDGNGGWK